MTLSELAEHVNDLIDQARKDGHNPAKVEVHTSHSSSGASSELRRGYLKVTDGSEDSGPISAADKGTPYVSFTVEG